MKIYNTSEARENLYKLVDQVSEIHEPVYVKGKRNNVVIIAEEDYRSMQETLYLLSIHGMRDSIKEGQAQSLDQCSDKLDW